MSDRADEIAARVAADPRVDAAQHAIYMRGGEGLGTSDVIAMLDAADKVDPYRERVDALTTLVDEILGTFTHKGSLGGIDDSRQSGWIRVEMLDEWRARAHP